MGCHFKRRGRTRRKRSRSRSRKRKKKARISPAFNHLLRIARTSSKRSTNLKMQAVVVQDWSEGPRNVTIDPPPQPTESQLRLRVLAAGLHQVVRARASGRHYSAKTLPHRVGVDCVGQDEATGQLYYALDLGANAGTFAEYILVDKAAAYPLPDTVDPASFAASMNPGMSSWMALTQRTRDLPRDYTALILGATSGSGRIAAHVARALGAGRVIGVARNEAALAAVEGLDERIVLRADVAETDFSRVEPDVVLDYVYGDATVHLLSSMSKTRKSVQYVMIGGVSRQEAMAIPSDVLRSYDLTIRGAGPGAWRLPALREEMKTLVPAMTRWKLLDAHKVALGDVEKIWNDQTLGSKGRIVVVP
ncbi:hypothetical protein F4778DRAFT_761077 [Xylariomycetidae sp. FL2044]|nr:hypothetical protein F4778DRAFT_761077 [Xylariomycetidae sp. FL2044]